MNTFYLLAVIAVAAVAIAGYFALKYYKLKDKYKKVDAKQRAQGQFIARMAAHQAVSLGKKG